MSLVRADSGATPAQWDPEQIQILKDDLGVKTDAHLAYFAQVCAHKDLDPFLDEIVPIYYGDDMVIQETVQGLRTIAERSGLYGGYRGPFYSSGAVDQDGDFVWIEGIWPDDQNPPAAAKFLVIRKDWTEPAPGYARWASCVQLNRYGKPRDLWAKRPDEMLAKTAEARALKRAFAKEFARAGVNVRTLTDAQVVAAEGRRIGLTDDERHALVSEVTDGRTESSTELTDDERLDTRSRLARRRAKKVVAAGPGGEEVYWVDPETGERFNESPDQDADTNRVEILGPGAEPDPTRPTTGAPAPAEEQEPAAEQPASGGESRPEPPPVPPMPEPRDADRADIAELKQRIRSGLTDVGWVKLIPWLEACKINPTLDGISRPRVGAVNAELDLRGLARGQGTDG